MTNLQREIQNLLNLYKGKKLNEAESFNKNLIATYPGVIFLYNFLGLILTDQKKMDEAIEWYKKGIKVNPKYSMIYNNLGTIYKSREDYVTAEKYFLKSISLDKKIPEPQNNLGNLYLALNKIRLSIKCYKAAIKNNSKFYPAYFNLGTIHMNMGKFKLAKKYFEKSIKLNPYLIQSHRSLSQLIKYTKREKHLTSLKEIFDNKKTNDLQKTEISFALGKAYDDMKDYDKAFYYYKTGNDLRRKKVTFSIDAEKKEFELIKKIFYNDLYKSKTSINNLDDRAIFIVGMPRSGTTLVEQILSSHPDVFGADELYYLPKLIEENFSSVGLVNTDEESKMISISNKYISNLKKISQNSKKVTDKLPINFKNIGLIKLILPNSKIIHCSRNPKDTCLSIYKNYFVNTKLNFAYNLDELTEFYQLYINLMNYWKKILPHFIYEIKYEELIKNPNSEIKSLLKYCNLTWNNKCLKFYNNKRPIKTASYTQARKKIYSSSVNSWERYYKYLNPFFSKIGRKN